MDANLFLFFAFSATERLQKMNEEKRPKEVPSTPSGNIDREGKPEIKKEAKPDVKPEVKKEASPEVKPVEPPAGGSAPDAGKPEGAAEKKEAEKKEEAEKQKKPAECIVCNKSIKNKWYYRNGKYYCTKSCWKKSKKKNEKAEEKK